MTEQDLERLRELAQRTEDIRPSKSFADAVMLAVESDRADEREMGVVDGLNRSGWVAVAFAAVAAAASVVVSLDAQQSFDDDILSSVDVVEVLE